MLRKLNTFRLCVQTSSGAHSASYPGGTRVSFLGNIPGGTRSWPPTCI